MCYSVVYQHPKCTKHKPCYSLYQAEDCEMMRNTGRCFVPTREYVHRFSNEPCPRRSDDPRDNPPPPSAWAVAKDAEDKRIAEDERIAQLPAAEIMQIKEAERRRVAREAAERSPILKAAMRGENSIKELKAYDLDHRYEQIRSGRDPNVHNEGERAPRLSAAEKGEKALVALTTFERELHLAHVRDGHRTPSEYDEGGELFQEDMYKRYAKNRELEKLGQ